jgi:hypothetical protein
MDEVHIGSLPTTTHEWNNRFIHDLISGKRAPVTLSGIAKAGDPSPVSYREMTVIKAPEEEVAWADEATVRMIAEDDTWYPHGDPSRPRT